MLRIRFVADPPVSPSFIFVSSHGILSSKPFPDTSPRPDWFGLWLCQPILLLPLSLDAREGGLLGGREDRREAGLMGGKECRRHGGWVRGRESGSGVVDDNISWVVAERGPVGR